MSIRKGVSFSVPGKEGDYNSRNNYQWRIQQFKDLNLALVGVARWIEHWPVNQNVTGSQVQFPVRAHT